VRRGEVWWASLPEPGGSGPGFRRPVLVIQSDPFNESRNILLERRQSRLPRDSVINVSQILTIDKAFLTERVSLLRAEVMARVEAGLKLVLGL
jgi:mRNA interferase MazF